GGGSLLQLTAPEWRWLCLASVIPSVLCLVILVFGIAEVVTEVRKPVTGDDVETHRLRLSPTLRRYLLAVAVFGLANSSDAFILLRSKDMGYTLLQTLAMIMMLNLFSSLTALPAAML